MTKQEQIKEMGQIICERSKDGICLLDKASCDGICGWTLQAQTIYNAGYRKVPEDAIVLTKEELDKLHIFDDEMFERILNYEREKGRKETAKEILILLGKGFDETKMTEFKNLPWYKLFCRELKHRYSVEVKE